MVCLIIYLWSYKQIISDIMIHCAYTRIPWQTQMIFWCLTIKKSLKKCSIPNLKFAKYLCECKWSCSHVHVLCVATATIFYSKDLNVLYLFPSELKSSVSFNFSDTIPIFSFSFSLTLFWEYWTFSYVECVMCEWFHMDELRSCP